MLDAHPEDADTLELLEQLYLETGDITAASETIGRQLMLAEDELSRASLWRRRAKIYRDSLGRDAEGTFADAAAAARQVLAQTTIADVLERERHEAGATMYHI